MHGFTKPAVQLDLFSCMFSPARDSAELSKLGFVTSYENAVAETCQQQLTLSRLT